jgi:DnaJ domain
MVLLKSRLSFSLALAKLPTLHLYAAAPPDVLAQVKSILEEFYTDGIDQVLSAELDSGGDIVGEFSDRVGARQVKRYQYQITDDEVTYKLLNPNEVSSFARVAERIRSIESYKPLFGKGSRAGQKKHCRISTPCGDSCIAVGKVCRKKPGSAVKAKIAEAKKGLGGKAKPAQTGGTNGAPEQLVAGAIAMVPKKAGEEKSVGKDIFGVDPIDSKYASENPSDADVANWIKDKVAQKPSKAQAEADTINDVKRDIWGTDAAGKQLSDRVVDANSYAKAKYSAEQAEKKRRIKFGLRQNDDESLWFDSLTDFDDIPGKKKKLGKGKTPELNAKYQKEYDDAVHFREVEAPRRAKELAAKNKAINSQSRSQRLATFENEFNALREAKLKQSQDLHERVMAGDRKAVAQKQAQIFNRIPSEHRYDPVNYKAKNVAAAQTETVKSYLQAVSGNTLVPEFNLPNKFSQSDVKKAYRKLSTKYHPDAGGSPQAFRKLTSVYESLLNKASN